jgi:hypothetical protein
MEQRNKMKFEFPKNNLKTPKIYAFKDIAFPGLLKIGYTVNDVDKRVKEQYQTKRPIKSYTIVFEKTSLRPDGSFFTDKDIHKYLRRKGIQNPDGEWFKCDLSSLESAYLAVKNNVDNNENRTLDFELRPEQKKAVEVTKNYFSRTEFKKTSKKAHFLWNAKMRFGKTFTTYKLAKEMNFTKILILTFKPAVEDSWKEDLLNHIDFEKWQFISPENINEIKIDSKNPIVCFGSFQDYLGKTSSGGIKPKNEWVHKTEWDLIVLDEYHYGAWNKRSQELISNNDYDDEINKEFKQILEEDGFYDKSLSDFYDESNLPIFSKFYLYLSGTPFKAIATGEFIEEQIFNWTYSDEQNAKFNYKGVPEKNPYLEMPQIALFTYQLPDNITTLVDKYGQDEFSLNEFFKSEGKGKSAKFVYEDLVQKWLDIIRGIEQIHNIDSKDNANPPLPYSDTILLNACNHSMWFLPSVSSCDAMENLIKLRQNKFYQDYSIINASGNSVGVGNEAIIPVRKAMGDEPTISKTIILTCGKLTTGVTIKPLSSILMLRGINSPETYFQSAFRIQSPWFIFDEMKKNKIILKEKCFIFDFDPNRALNQVIAYSNRLDYSSLKSPKDKIEEFIKFLPVLAYDGSSMKEINAAEVLDIVTFGTTSTLLARKWSSSQLVNVDVMTLNSILGNKQALDAVMKIEGFRSLGEEVIKKVINISEKIKKLKSKDKKDNNNKKERTKEEKELFKLRRDIQKKLIKFATRIPIFMYLTDYREESLLDIIRKIEPQLFVLVTGLRIDEFELLLSLNLFNSEKMNLAILQFRRYEDSSLFYTGINKYKAEKVGLFDTSITIKEIKN